jgi:hypothetical protein
MTQLNNNFNWPAHEVLMTKEMILKEHEFRFYGAAKKNYRSNLIKRVKIIFLTLIPLVKK